MSEAMSHDFELLKPTPQAYKDNKGSLAELVRHVNFDPASRLTFIVLGKIIRLNFEAQLLTQLEPLDLFLKTLQTIAHELPDRQRFATLKPRTALEIREAIIEIKVFQLTGSPSLFNSDELTAAIFLPKGLSKALARIIVTVAVFQSLRQRAGSNPTPSKANKANLGTAMLALVRSPGGAGEFTPLALKNQLTPHLANQHLLQRLSSVLSRSSRPPGSFELDPQKNIYFDLRRFDGLSLTGKLRVIFAGQLAWWTSLSFGLLALFRGLFDKFPGYYSEARAALTSQVRQQGLVKQRLRKRFAAFVKQGRLLAVLELFWSSWNPALTRVALRPFFRLCGGNSRPFSATLLSFWFSGAVVHFMGLSTLIIGCAYPYRDSSRMARMLASDQVVQIQGLIWIVYTVLGTLVGLVKLHRALRIKK